VSRWALPALLLIACGPGRTPQPCKVEGQGGDARIFTVTHRVTLDDAKTAGTFADSFRRHLDDARACLSETSPNLIVFPEDSGLVAWFTGRQGLAGRNASDTASAFNALYFQARQPADAYRRRFPGISDTRALTLAISDRAWRTMDETFGTLARDANAWVVTSANLPYSQLDASAGAAIFRDPDATGPAYVASSPEVFNAALVYSPTGERVGRVDKVFLTDVEEKTLQLSAGPLEGLKTFPLPFATLGIATSRDAFYPPFAQRLDDLNADLVVQPEAFSGWVTEEHPGDWLPDVMLAAGWSLTQKYTSVRHLAAPMLTGNVFDVAFDGQAFITAKATPTQPRRAFIASDPSPGFLAIGPWAYATEKDDTLPMEERRLAVRELGRDLLPGSKDTFEGRTGDSVIAADLELGTAAKTATFTRSIAVAPSAQGHQRNPAIAYGDNGQVYVVWSDFRSGSARVWLARSSDDGATFPIARPVDPAPGTSSQAKPTIAAGTDGLVAIAWQDDARGSEQIRWAISRDSGLTFTAGWAERTARAQWEPSIVALGGTGWALAWADFRDVPTPHVRARCFDVSTPQGAASQPVDPEGSFQLQPSLAGKTRDGLFVAWVDHREGDWQIFSRGGPLCDAPGKAFRLSFESQNEVLASDPQTATAPDGRVMVTWDEIRDRRAHHDVVAAELTRGVWQLQGSPTRVAYSRFRPSPFWQGTFRAVVQDQQPSKNGLSIWTIGSNTPLRFDDTFSAPNQLTRPRAAARRDSTNAVIVFEDDRDGWVRVRAQTRP